MRSAAELDVYEVAYMCGGPERVAMVVLAGLVQDGRIAISSDRHRVSAAGGRLAIRSRRPPSM